MVWKLDREMGSDEMRATAGLPTTVGTSEPAVLTWSAEVCLGQRANPYDFVMI